MISCSKFNGLFIDREVPDWPKLLYLYSRLKSGITVLEWMQENDVHQLNVDPRRFVSFGVIKVCGMCVWEVRTSPYNALSGLLATGSPLARPPRLR